MATVYRSISDLAKGPLPTNEVFHRIFRIKELQPKCFVSSELADKYGLSQHNVQQVLAISNRVTHEVCWWNPVRAKKPQNFKFHSGDGAPADPTGGGGPERCDFCAWSEMTAEDSFGRIEGLYAVSASNLFKYCAPQQGVILFKHHEPLKFTLPQLADLVTVAGRWFDEAAVSAVREGQPASELHPLLLWNSGARAGASFYHGHAQSLLSALPFPALRREADLIRQYEAAQYCYHSDVYHAHQAAGLAWHHVTAAGDSAKVYAALCPLKNCEVVVQGTSLTCPAFHQLLFAAMRALIDDLGVRTFNASIHNIPLPFLVDDARAALRGSNGQDAPGSNLPSHPVVARVVSRGQPTSVASDFGGLEVFGAASIGHTDPFKVAEALSAALHRLPS